MTEPMTHKEFSQKGGKARTERKKEASRKSLEKARAKMKWIRRTQGE